MGGRLQSEDEIFIGVGCKSVKHYITYRYLFDRNKEYKRYPIPVEKDKPNHD